MIARMSTSDDLDDEQSIDAHLAKADECLTEAANNLDGAIGHLKSAETSPTGSETEESPDPEARKLNIKLLRLEVEDVRGRVRAIRD
jgi:hypothetical protein